MTGDFVPVAVDPGADGAEAAAVALGAGAAREGDPAGAAFAAGAPALPCIFPADEVGVPFPDAAPVAAGEPERPGETTVDPAAELAASGPGVAAPDATPGVVAVSVAGWAAPSDADSAAEDF